jgi:hypothetical protein
MLLHGQVVETFFDQQTHNTVGVEDEVGAVRALVADDAAKKRDMSVYLRLELIQLGGTA